VYPNNLPYNPSPEHHDFGPEPSNLVHPAPPSDFASTIQQTAPHFPGSLFLSDASVPTSITSTALPTIEPHGERHRPPHSIGAPSTHSASIGVISAANTHSASSSTSASGARPSTSKRSRAKGRTVIEDSYGPIEQLPFGSFHDPIARRQSTGGRCVLQCGFCLEFIGTSLPMTQGNPHFEQHQRANKTCLNIQDLDARRAVALAGRTLPNSTPSGQTVAPAAPATSASYQCKGITVEWGDEDVLCHYPFQRHAAGTRGEFPWKLCGYDEDTQQFRVRASNCLRNVSHDGPCHCCFALRAKIRDEYNKMMCVDFSSKRSYWLRSWQQLHDLAQYHRGQSKLATFQVDL
jgi:hypothetical protein